MTFLDALTAFLAAKEAAGVRPATCVWYRRNISIFYNWLVEVEAGSTWTSPATIEQFLVHERRRGLSPATVSARYRALSAFFSWMQGRYGLDSPMASVEAPRVPERPLDYVTLGEYAAVYGSISGETWPDARDRALITLLFWSGLRVGELVALRPHHIDTDLSLITVTRGKGGKARIVPTHPDISQLMLSYLYSRPPWRGPELLVSSDGSGGIRGPLTKEGVRQILIRRCEDAGVRYLHPHLWRHGFAMEFLNAGADMSSISAMMGHSSVKVTESVYAHWLTQGLKAEYEAARVRLETRARGG